MMPTTLPVGLALPEAPSCGNASSRCSPGATWKKRQKCCTQKFQIAFLADDLQISDVQLRWTMLTTGRPCSVGTGAEMQMAVATGNQNSMCVYESM